MFPIALNENPAETAAPKLFGRIVWADAARPPFALSSRAPGACRPILISSTDRLGGVRSGKPSAVRDRAFGRHQNNPAILVRAAEHQDLRQERADLPRREIYDGEHLPSG